MREDFKMMERNLSKFATKEITDKIIEKEQSNKNVADIEFERFQ